VRLLYVPWLQRARQPIRAPSTTPSVPVCTATPRPWRVVPFQLSALAEAGSANAAATQTAITRLMALM
jgi:hypothetical protein